MAKLIGGADKALNMSHLDLDLDGKVTAGASQIHVDHGGGWTDDFFGSFTYKNGQLSGGTITGITETRSGGTHFKLTDLHVSAKDFQALVAAHNQAGIEALVLSGNDQITGGTHADTLVGLAGNDVIDGGKNLDTMIGGLGNDVYIVDDKADKVVEDVSAGRDRIEASLTYTLPLNVEDLTLTGTHASAGTGNGQSNHITGNSAANTLTGFGGNDTLNGGSGNDHLIGGKGQDMLTGGAGDDIFVFGKGDIGTSATKTDTIVDFKHLHDKIDLSSMDAIPGGGHDPFRFIATHAFTGTAGEIRESYSGNDTYLSVDTNGDKQADWILKIDGHFSIHLNDFVTGSVVSHTHG